jgi:hypothetical protein
MSATFSSKQLSAAGLLSKARRFYTTIYDECGYEIALVDHLMPGLDT